MNHVNLSQKSEHRLSLLDKNQHLDIDNLLYSLGLLNLCLRGLFLPTEIRLKVYLLRPILQPGLLYHLCFYRLLGHASNTSLTPHTVDRSTSHQDFDSCICLGEIPYALPLTLSISAEANIDTLLSVVGAYGRAIVIYNLINNT